MHVRVKEIVVGFALLIVALPLWAAHMDKQTWTVLHPSMIGTQQLKPGAYELKADEGKNDLTVIQDGKVIADVPGHWVQLPAKALQSEVSIDGNAVTQVQFEGRTAAFQLH
jgi:hypothetical protein